MEVHPHGMGYQQLASLLQPGRGLDKWERSLTPASCSTASEVPSSPSDDLSAEQLRREAPPEEPAPTLTVDGVPGSMSHSALTDVLAGLGVHVRQAWLRKLPSSECAPTPLGRRGCHQGSGFLVLQDRYAMERIMGCESSRVLDLPGGVRLKLKRIKESSELFPSHSAPECPQVKDKRTPDPEVWRASVALGLRQGLAMPAAVAAASRALLPASHALRAAGGDQGPHRRGGKNRRARRLVAPGGAAERPPAPAQRREEVEPKAFAPTQLQDSILWL